MILFFFYFKGDENDPEQQSDSEEGSTKGEPQVTDIKAEPGHSILILVSSHVGESLSDFDIH